mmetsp:Transcript_15116/g.24882  ORF Transcript_15116/g.24882 Transcript_15116/m.24882 type:complete len:440 (-) Transcript_15116:513-1832(-)|eukprot:CAMPEP_0184643924 /NCGR_PEP_ID=MMETSP0308-20130426/729_1 /TAXON_ID=38269 /ORGANISM="Gloeochaete witrockiana, Strain SAG 46.84" /LENGTH=439 /DNA_ID=CAMNT_0027072189 /DNA_START=81 /DNA_END=1400 /DNA_ORIENTATION=+
MVPLDDDDLYSLVERIHASGTAAVFCIAGAGSQALTWLLSVPNASRTVIQATIPYHRAALTKFLGTSPSQAVSASTARRMAHSAFVQGQELIRIETDGFEKAGDEIMPRLVGVACTATIATSRAKLGEHRAHVAVWTDASVATYSLTLDKSFNRTREQEDSVVSKLVLRALADAAQVEFDIPLALTENEQLELTLRHFESIRIGGWGDDEETPDDIPNTARVTEVDAEDPLKLLLSHKAHVLVYLKEHKGMATVDGTFSGVILPGSFNPLHEGHIKLATVAAKMSGQDFAFEISVQNADKPPLEEEDIRGRIAPMLGRYNVILTRMPLLKDKAHLFPGSAFAIGYDTYERLLDLRYYGGTEQGLVDALNNIRSTGCRFLVAGRVDRNGQFVALEPEKVNRNWVDLFVTIPVEDFRVNLSSTEIRNLAAAAAATIDAMIT